MISVDMHGITGAHHREYETAPDRPAFDSVRILSGQDSVTLYLPHGTGAAVAAAIRDAIAPQDATPDQVPMLSGDMGLVDGDKVKLVAWEDGRGPTGREVLTLKGAHFRRPDGSVAWWHPSTNPPGTRPLFIRVPK
jgi:hypothetical protein